MNFVVNKLYWIIVAKLCDIQITLKTTFITPSKSSNSVLVINLDQSLFSRQIEIFRDPRERRFPSRFNLTDFII